MAEIPAGPFYRNPGALDTHEADRDELVALPPYLIDRTEVTRGAFALYGALEPLTGEAAARTSYLDFDRHGGDRLPVVGVNAFTAASYCAFLGKALPSQDQWQKALRGGLTVNEQENPAPKRRTPWVTAQSKHPMNIDGEDEFPNLAPVGSFPDDASPYGLVDMAGNVSEWSRTEVGAGGMRGLRFVLGAHWGVPQEHAYLRNTRPERYLDFSIGIRCVREPSP
jgi:formylglycine-generating enzyme required for sulfatase activity